MGRSMGKLALLAALIALAVLFGMEMADDGIRTVYGPVGSDGATVASGGNAADSRAEQRSRYYAEEPQGIAYEGETDDKDASAAGSAARRQTSDSARSGQAGGGGAGSVCDPETGWGAARRQSGGQDGVHAPAVVAERRQSRRFAF
ncbi:hypothetical protein OMP38_21755 [Cohnella ginsengisoli]|uniref:DUF3679 domain-containing protein n=1 Tax=Cohnella ginsengisoli TaxID=425004 RepID=A0A9X4KJP9_9BACL|nr:hypothetical protein [Cohnella ginsengisoli]MDG0793180.1 hypothetical protein [Cohnella ginsengisoli]